MQHQYLTIDQAAARKGVTTRAIHEALCEGHLSAVLIFSAGTCEPRFVDPWDLEFWSPTPASRRESAGQAP